MSSRAIRIAQTYCSLSSGEKKVSIVRIGLSETDKFADGYDAIFGKKRKKVAKAPKNVSKTGKRKSGKKTTKKK